MQLTVTVAECCHISAFDVLRQDTDEVIMLINYLLEKDNDTSSYGSGTTTTKDNRVRVNDATATNGWF